jgi:uracil-DNA glycosylase
MTNYQKYNTLSDLRAAIVEGVQPEWLANQKFVNALDIAVEATYTIAKFATKRFCPEASDILAVLKLVKPTDVKVVCVAQDPYPNLRDAVGIAFHSPAKYCPVSARHINANLIKHGHLSEAYATNANYVSYVKQGVLLLNRTLTTVEGESSAHTNIWKGVSEALLSSVSSKSVALLLGNDARALTSVLASKVKVEHVHPAARQPGEFERKDIFKAVNDGLQTLGLSPIDWGSR